LAQEHFIIFSAKMKNSKAFCQSDGGQKWQEVRLFTLLDESNKTHSEHHGLICQFWAGMIYTCKISATVAEGTLHHACKKFGCPLKQISGCCGDSSAGTPKFYANSLNTLGI
jgi:hypothetical protein